ncbi:MAG: GNAT family N-acetyltransferase [Acutalibacter sp.]|nr:GNAT family N-acetyltransferase [Acutalibacter sp.]
MIMLVPAKLEDAPALLDIQRRAFGALLEKYQDFDTNPAAEPLEKIQWRLNSPERDYWLIQAEGQPVGLACVRQSEKGRCVSPIGLLPEWQGKGVGRQVMALLEKSYPDDCYWELSTIFQEPGLCRFYESLGYKRTGSETQVLPHMTVVGYEKYICKGEKA